MKETTHQAFDNYGNAVYMIQKLPDFPPVFTPTEPRIKVSPYAKFDKFHRKHKKEMNEDQIKAIAEEYARKTNVDFMDILCVTRNTKNFLKWLSTRYCIIERKK